MGKFKFRSFAQRVEDVDIDVFHRLDSIKLEPQHGTSFFHENLLQWREVNAAREFVEIYEELLPMVQTLPQLLLHKKTIVDRLLSCLQPSAALSLEPIIGLTAILSRDLAQDFLDLIPKIVDGFFKLLQLGGDRDSNILEMVFTNLAYIFKYMLKFLTKDVVFVLKVTKKVRFYSQDYVRSFAAEAISFVLRNAPLTQIIKGVRKAVSEADNGPVQASACSSLLTFTLKGPSQGFHSRAGELLKVLLDSSALGGMWEKKGDVVVAVLKEVLANVVQEIRLEKLELLWRCLLEEIPPALVEVDDDNQGPGTQALRLLMLTNHLLEQKKLPAMNENKQLDRLALRVLKLVPNFVSKLPEEMLLHVLMFLLNCMKKRASSSIKLPGASSSWELAFEKTHLSSILQFVEKLVDQETEIVSAFVPLILRGLERCIDSSPARALEVLIKLFEKHGVRNVESSKLATSVESLVGASAARLRDGEMRQESLEQRELVWRALRCFPHLISSPDDSESSICLEYATLIDQALSSTPGELSEQDLEVWMAMLGASLSSHLEASRVKPEISKLLHLALKYSSSVQVLEAVCSNIRIDKESSSFSPELNHQSFLRNSKAFQKNLGDSNRKLRLATLNLLNLYEQTEQSSQIIQELSNIERMLLGGENSPRVTSLILHLKTRRNPGELAGLVFYGMLGVLQNRVTTFWDPAMDCLQKTFDEFSDSLPEFVSYLSSSQARVLAETQSENKVVNEFWGAHLRDTQFSTPPASVMSCLLRVAHKLSSRLASKSGDFASLFLEFIDQKSGSENSINGKDWSNLLRHWLQLLSQLKNIPGLPSGDILKNIFIDRFLVFKDPEIQKKALESVLLWKDVALTAYKEQLMNLISKDDLRDELASWNPGRESQQVADEHREELIPVLLRILYPKLSKRKVKRAKPAAARMRSCVLSFVSHLDPRELVTLFFLIFRPLESAFSDDALSKAQDETPAWRRALEQSNTENFIGFLDRDRVPELPFKKKHGFLQLAKELIETLDGEHIGPYLNPLLAFIIRLLESASLKPEAEKNPKPKAEKNPKPEGETNPGLEGKMKAEKKPRSSTEKDLRAMCLKLLALVLENFHNVELGPGYSEAFFSAVKHSIKALAEENAHSERPSALLGFFLKLSEDEAMAGLLLRDELLVPNVFSLLLADSLSLPVHTAVLSFVENLLAMRRGTMELLLVPHLKLLLEGILKQLTRKKPTSKSEKARNYLKQHLRILSRLSVFIDDPSRASEFLDIMLLFLNTKENVDFEIRAEVLTILRELSLLFDSENVSKCVKAFGPLLASMPSQEARTILCHCLEKLSAANTSLAPVAEVLSDLNSMSTSRIEELDYDRRQAAYGKLSNQFVSGLESPQASLILSHIVFDLESEDMRYNASSCLIIAVRAAAEGVLKESVRDFVYEFLFSRITNAMKSENCNIRREWIIVFRELVNRSTAATFLEFKCLTSSDPETDFFSNIIHVQIHRRIKAMTKFRAACENAQFSQRSLSKLFIPLFLHSLFEERTKDGNLIDSAIETIASVSSRLSWTPALKLVLRLFRMISSRSEHQKVLVRLVCLLLDKTQASRAEKLTREAEAGRILEDKVLPQLNKLIVTQDSVNVPVVLAAVKVLQQMPDEGISKNYPRICQTITNLLKSRAQETRDEARAALVGMVEILGSRFLQFTVKMLHASLKRGYERHVLGFTLNSILIRVAPQLEVGSIDYCVDDLMIIIEEEVFGEVSEEKEVESLARKMKERKQARGFDSLRLVSRVVSFRENINRLLKLVRERKPSSSSALEKLQAILRGVSAGVLENPSASDEELLSFVHRVLLEFLGEESSSCNEELLAEFGLMLLSSRLKSNQVKSFDLLDRFVQPLQRCLSSKFDGVVSGAMKCLSLLLRLPLASIQLFGGAIVKEVFSRARASSNSENSLTKLLTVLLRHCKTVSLSEAQARELLQLNIFVDIESQGSQALGLLKAIVERKLVVPELYDLIDRVQKLMVTSQVPALRQKSSEIMLQFLLDYPLGLKRLQHHFNFFLANIGYEHISGRESALEMLHTIIVKFPDPVIEEQSNGLFLTLMARLGSDKDASVQLLLEAVLKVLMGRVGANSLEQMKEFLLSWMNGEKQNLWIPATQGTRLLVEAIGQSFDRYFNSFWPAVLKILRSSSENTLEPRASNWKVAYNVLVLVEKLFQRLNTRMNSSCSEQTWGVIHEFLLHKNVSVRKAAARLLAIYLGNLPRHSLKQDETKFRLLMLAAISCDQMISPAFDEELGNQVAQNLTLVSSFLFPVSFREEDLESPEVVKALLMLKGKKESEESIDRLRKLMSREDFSVLVLVFQRLSKASLEEAQGKIFLSWYSSAVRQLQKQGSVQAFLPYILHNLFKVERSTAPVDLKTCAEVVRDEIRELVGAEKFATAFNNVSQEIKSRKENRKRAESIAALVDPESRAKKKIKLGQKRLAQRKRKRGETNKANKQARIH